MKPLTALLLACVACYVLFLAVGPISVPEATSDLDLGGGIRMTADGQIKVSHAWPVGPMRIPEESEYDGTAPR